MGIERGNTQDVITIGHREATGRGFGQTGNVNNRAGSSGKP